MNQKKYYPTAVALYITYFILGIAVTIMGQYKQSFAAMWGANQLADGSFYFDGERSGKSAFEAQITFKPL